MIDYIIENILFRRNEFTYGNNKKRKIFNSDLSGLRLMKINKIPTESCRFICKCENRNKVLHPAQRSLFIVLQFSSSMPISYLSHQTHSDSEKIGIRFAHKIVSSWH
jgi:hypothetical protein